MLSRFTERHARVAGVVLCVVCVAYFYLLDRLLFSSGHFSPIFHALLKFDVQTAWLALVVCLLAMAWNRPAPILQCVDFLGRHPVGLALAAVALLGVGSVAAYHAYPLSMDEYAAVFQAKIFASGHIAAQLPPGLVDWLIVRGFNGSFLMASPQIGRAIGVYWPGFALLLAPFQFLHMPWLCNALLSGVSIYSIYWITKEMTGDRRAGGWAMLFALASGAFVADGISYYSMQAHMTANLLYVAFLIKPSGYRVFGAGLVGSLALILHNPVPHALFGIPWIAAMLMQRERRRYLVPLIIGYLPGVGIALAWLMFRSEIGSGSHEAATIHGVVSGVFAWPNAPLLNSRVAALVKMGVWAMPCLFVLALLGYSRQRTDLRVRLLAWSAMLTFAAYLFVRFDQGHGWGSRYFHSAWGVIPILAGCAMTDRRPANSRLVSFAGATAILSLLLIVPFQLSQIDRFISAHLAQLGRPQRPGNNVYFIHPQGGFYVADMVQFDPLLRDRDLLLTSHGSELDAQLVQRNWPNAVKVSSGRAADQWWLGPEDQRLPIPGSDEGKQFVIVHLPPWLE
jgi:hypothetical protein